MGQSVLVVFYYTEDRSTSHRGAWSFRVPLIVFTCLVVCAVSPPLPHSYSDQLFDIISMHVFAPAISPPTASVSPKPGVEKSEVDELKNLAVADPTSGTRDKNERLAFQSKFDEAVEGGCVEVRACATLCSCV